MVDILKKLPSKSNRRWDTKYLSRAAYY